MEASETMSTNSASSPIPYMHNHSNDTSNDVSEKRRHKSSSDDSKVRILSNFIFELFSHSLKMNHFDSFSAIRTVQTIMFGVYNF